MNRTWKRFLCMVMALSMLFAILPLQAGASEIEETDAVAAAEETPEPTAEATGEAPPEETAATVPEETAPEATESTDPTEAAMMLSEEPTEDLGNVITAENSTITSDGTYTLAADFTGTVTVASGVSQVTIVGNGALWNENTPEPAYGTMLSAPNENVCIDCTGAAGVTLTLRDVYIRNNGVSHNLIDFSGAGNTLIFDGTVILDHDNGALGYAAIHCAEGSELTVYGSAGSRAYLYKNEQAAGIGGNDSETCGNLYFGQQGGANDFYIFIKGSKQGAVIGNGANCSGIPGDISFYSGIYNILGAARGALIGGSAGAESAAAGNVYVQGGLINLNVDFSGAAIGGGGYDAGNDKGGGYLYVTGGSVRTYIDSNAVSSWGSYGVTEAGVNDAAIRAEKVNADGEPVYLLTLDVSAMASESYTIAVDGATFYAGEAYGYCYVNENVNRDINGDGSADLPTTPNGTPGNWGPLEEECFYLYVTGADHTVSVNGTDVTYYWDELTENFYTENHADVTFYVDAEDAEIILSDGIGYTYLEQTHEGYFFEAVEAVEPDEEAGIEAVEAEPAKTMFSLAPGEYTFTITREGYYASSGSFQVSEDGHAIAVGSSTNINSYMKDDTFTIPMTPFIPSTNAGAWDGKTLDVSWYDEDASELHIATPAQLAGMAAIINGIYNAEITAIIDDADGDGATEVYTPYDYAHLENRKIVAANSEGTTGSQNLVTTSTYWYGARSSGTFLHDKKNAEQPLPADFNNVTVYLDCDLDMGGYQADSVWTGARYMTIGGQSLMHYIDYGAWMSDGYSHIGSSFNGTLDGQGHVVYNMYCDRYATGSNYGDSVSVGLVGRLGVHDSDPAVLYADSPTVRNVAVAGYVYGRRSVGGIVGKTGKSYGTLIENCLNFAQIINTDAKGVGGICGAGWNLGIIRNCANFGSVYAGRQNAGGICGSCEQPVINCYNVAYVDAIDYKQGQSIGTDNGGATYTNVYWLTGSSIADSVESYQYPAVYRHSNSDTLTELTSFAAFTTDEFLRNLNGSGRVWTFASESNTISSYLAAASFRNCKLDTAGITAAGMPVPRCFTVETATVTSIEKITDPENLTYVEGQTFDPAGLKIVAYWSDSTSEVLEDYTVSIDRPLEIGDTAVTVSGTVGGIDYRYEFAITVSENLLNTMEITSKPSSTVYALGEKFDPSGMVVKATYTAAPSTKVTLSEEEYTCAVEGSLVTVSYTFKDKTLTESFELTMLDTPAPSLNAENFYELTCSNDLLWFANQVKGCKRTDINAVVMNDIAVDSSFTGIGSYGAQYAGTFDGRGYTLTLDMEVYGSAGLILYANGATIRNVTVAGSVTSTASSSGMGGIVGYVGADATIVDNCVNQASLAGTGYVGGIVGKADGAVLTVSGCTNEGSITSSGKYAGGIAGYLAASANSDSGVTVSDCVNYGAVSSSMEYAGGIAGCTVLVTVTRCGNEAAVTGLYDVGGILGRSQNAGDLVCSCYNLGDVTASGSAGNNGVGGIVGLDLGNIRDVYNLGSVSTNDTSAAATFGVGGIVGTIDGHWIKSNGITNAYNAGTISGSGSLGAAAGYVYYTSVLENFHWLEGTAENAVGMIRSGNTVTGEPAVQTHAGLRALARTLGAAFKTDRGYPILQWQESDFLLGDVNLDGAVDQSDVALLYAAVLEQENLNDKQLEYGDVNLDGGTDQSDVVLLLSFILGKVATL